MTSKVILSRSDAKNMAAIRMHALHIAWRLGTCPQTTAPRACDPMTNTKPAFLLGAHSMGRPVARRSRSAILPNRRT
jgi:hypothetical protein